MKKRVLFIPLDNRPCTYKMPIRVGRVANLELITPPEKLLGRFHKPGDCEEIIKWIQEIEGNFLGAIISTDMPIYGGLVASRKMIANEETAKTRLEKLLHAIKLKKEKLGKVYLFSSLFRNAPTYLDESFIPLIEKVIKFSVESYHAGKGDDRAKRVIEKLKKDIPPKMLNEYLSVRRRNFSVNKILIEKAKDGIFDFLLIGIDDSKIVGLNIQEKEKLQAIIESEDVNDRVMISTGTDEATSLLLSRLLCDMTGINPRVLPVYSNPEGKKITGRYEDRSFEDVIKLQVRTAGGVLTAPDEDADMHLYVHTPSGRQKEAGGQTLHLGGRKNLMDFTCSIDMSLKSGISATIADVFYANGADNIFARALVDNINILSLSGFAAWNTAGNSLGTAIAHGIVKTIAGKIVVDEEERESSLRSHVFLLLERFVDDWLYQSNVRPRMCTEALWKRVSIYHLDEQTEYFENRIQDRLSEGAVKLMESMRGNEIGKISPEKSLFFSPLDTPSIKLPWGRLFEVSVGFHKENLFS
ncbi:MAG: DUF4127 family protein [Candidatus Eremiobacteraeota bacterium]|nr:DUF4127 family protein [Candidatus Eremiobacteraeota bacterium]